MPARHDVNGWLSHNELRNYPFKENAGVTPFNAVSKASVTPLPCGALIDLVITTPYTLFKDVAPGFEVEHIHPTFKLRSIIKSPTEVTLTFSESFTGDLDELDIAEVTVDLATFVEREPYKLTGLVAATHGVVVFGQEFRRYMESLVLGEYLLDDANGELQERTVRDNPFSRVTSISELGNTAQMLVGDVKLEEGHNIQLRILPERNGIEISAIPGAGAGVFCGRGCAGTFPDTVLVPNGDVWKYKVFKDGTIPAPTRSFLHAIGGRLRGGAPLDYFEEDFDDLLWAEASMPYRRGVGGSQSDFRGLHIFEENTEVAARKWVELPEDLNGLLVEVTLGWDDYVEAYWNEVPITPLINSGGAQLCRPFASASNFG